MDRETALTKIKKCLALGRSAETHEAAAALRQAQKLMAEFRVTDRELSLVDVHEARAKASSTAVNLWEVWLANVVADAFGCETFTMSVGKYNDAGNYVRTRFYVFVGMESSATVAGYTHEVLSRQCARARLEHIRKQPRNCKPITKTSRGDEFAKGWVAAVERLVERFAHSEKNEALLLAYIETKHPDMKSTKPRDSTRGRKTDAGHHHAGYRAGEKAELHRGVDGQQQRLLAGS